MTVQKVAFAKTARINKPYKKQNIKNNKQKNNIKSKEGSLKKALFAMGILAAAGIGIGTLIYKRNTKNIENLAQETTEKAASAINESKLGQKAEEVIDNLSGDKNTAQKVNKLLLDTADSPKVNQKTAEAIEDLSGESSVTQQVNEAISNALDENKTSRVIKKLPIGKNTTEAANEALSDTLNNSGVKKVGEDLKIKVIHIGDDAAPIQQEIKKVSPLEQAQQEFMSNVKRSTQEYRERLVYNLRLSDRIKIIKYNLPPENGAFSISKIKRFQLKALSEEQINALNDGTLYRLLSKKDGGKKLNHMRFIKSLSPEQLIRIQENKNGLEKFFHFVENDIEGYEYDCLTKFLREL